MSHASEQLEESCCGVNSVAANISPQRSPALGQELHRVHKATSKTYEEHE